MHISFLHWNIYTGVTLFVTSYLKKRATQNSQDYLTNQPINNNNNENNNNNNHEDNNNNNNDTNHK